MAAMSLEQIQQRLEQGVTQLTPHVLRWVGPEARRLRSLLLWVGAIWLLLVLAQALWLLMPATKPAVELPGRTLNPLLNSAPSRANAPVAVSTLMGWNLFGQAGEQTVVEPVLLQTEPENDIEDGARESRLDLKLTGIVAVSEEGLGKAIIEHQRQQKVYAVNDELPVGGGKVKLAKVLADRVVIDNGGTYELIRLFDDNGWSASVESTPVANDASEGVSVVDKRVDAQTRRVANDYRQRLYSDPQSLAKVVRISAERREGRLRGYRVQPGSDRQQFQQLGFKGGDVITNVNGIELDNPANAVQLYQLMRTASEAVFTVERAGQQMMLTVALGNE